MSLASGSIDLKSLKVAGDGAGKYITKIDSNGIKIHAENNTNTNYSLINAEGMEIFQGDTVANSISVAKFGVVTRIGAEGNANISINDKSISGYGEDGKEFFTFSNGSTTMDTSILHKIYEGSDFPSTETTALSFTLPSGVKSGSTIWIEYYFQYPSHGSQTLAVTQGTASSPSGRITIGGRTYTPHVSYDGNDNITNIYISPQYGGTISCRIKYTRTDLAPSFEIGGELYAGGGYSYAEGYCSQAAGDFSHAEGYNSIAYYTGCHAEGQWTKAGRTTNGVPAGGYSAHAEGYNTTASGNVSHAEGNYTTASGSYSHAEGGSCVASNNYSHAEGHNTTASGQYSHAEGYSQNWGGQVDSSTNASGDGSHAEGGNTKASGNYSHVEGYASIASGSASHAEGNSSVASGARSHAQNEGTTAAARAQTVIGSYNVEDDITSTTHASNQNEYGHYALIVGNGTYNTHSNAMTVDWNGDVDAKGNITAGGTINAVNNAFTVDSNGNVTATGNITLRGHDSPIGFTVVKTGGESGSGADWTSDTNTISANTPATIGSFALSQGVWVVNIRARFSPSSSGAHMSHIGVATATSDQNQDTRYGTGTLVNQHNITMILTLNDETTYNIIGYANVAGKWIRTNSNGMSVRAVRIR